MSGHVDPPGSPGDEHLALETSTRAKDLPRGPSRLLAAEPETLRSDTADPLPTAPDPICQ
jgi:hypothetical protein